MYLLLSNGWKQAKIDESPIHIYNSKMKMNRTSNWNERSRSQSPNEMFAAYLFSKLHSTRLRNEWMIIIFELVYAFHLLSINTYRFAMMMMMMKMMIWYIGVPSICEYTLSYLFVGLTLGHPTYTHTLHTPVKTNTQNT